MSGKPRRTEIRTRRKRQVVESLGGKCLICGWTGNDICLDTHHVDQSKKHQKLRKVTNAGHHSFKITDMPVDEANRELANCALLCAICHRLVHADAVYLPIALPEYRPIAKWA